MAMIETAAERLERILSEDTGAAGRVYHRVDRALAMNPTAMDVTVTIAREEMQGMNLSELEHLMGLKGYTTYSEHTRGAGDGSWTLTLGTLPRGM